MDPASAVDSAMSDGVLVQVFGRVEADRMIGV